MNMKPLYRIGIFVCIVSCFNSWAQVQPASVFGDHMVLQRNMVVPVWGTASPGEKVTVTLNNSVQRTTAAEDGRWMAKLKAMKPGGPFQLKVAGKNEVVFNDVYIGEVWLCSGQSNMDMTVAQEDRYWCGVINEKEEVASANYPLIRVFDTEFTPAEEPQPNVKGMWEVCSPQTVGHFSAAAYFFARDLFNKYKTPIGLITTAYGASTAEAWTSRPALQAHPQLAYLVEEYLKKCGAYDTSKVAQEKYRKAFDNWKAEADKAVAEGKDKPREPKNPNPRKDQHSPYVLYNGMVAPLVPYAIRGALWYQGESNGPTAKIYGTIMETLIKDWRTAWGQGDFPFLYVQLANHQAVITDPVKDDPMVLVREGQLKNLSIANTGMVVAIDNADPQDANNIHPKNKQAIGKRLALIAESMVYGEKIVSSGPLYNKMSIENNGIRIHFRNTGKGLKISGDSLTGFAIAGDDKKFMWANAKIENNTVVVSHPDIAHPKAVRYGWSKNPPVNLYNEDDLPASPFRTDTEN
jgi:sialate O-acetylesterase